MIDTTRKKKQMANSWLKRPNPKINQKNAKKGERQGKGGKHKKEPWIIKSGANSSGERERQQKYPEHIVIAPVRQW